MTEYDTITDVPVDEHFLNELREAGASELFIEVVSLEDLPAGVTRNSARLEAQKYCFWNDEISTETFHKYKSYGGGFFTSLWEGDRTMIMSSADSNNHKILEQIGFIQFA